MRISEFSLHMGLCSFCQTCLEIWVGIGAGVGWIELLNNLIEQIHTNMSHLYILPTRGTRRVGIIVK